MNYFLFHKGKRIHVSSGGYAKATSGSMKPVIIKFIFVLLPILALQLFTELKAQTVSLDLKNA
jgi:hypothetical protein